MKCEIIDIDILELGEGNVRLLSLFIFFVFCGEGFRYIVRFWDFRNFYS